MRPLTTLLLLVLLAPAGCPLNAGGYKTAAIPAGARRWFLSPYTVRE